jgi:hypothetical protein
VTGTVRRPAAEVLHRVHHGVGLKCVV